MFFIVASLIFYSIALLFGTAAARHLNANLAAAINNIVSAILPIIAALPLLNYKLLQNGNTRFGILMAIIGGIFVAFFVITLNKSFAVNKIGIVTPIIYGGTIFLTTIASYFLFKEKITMLQGVGLAFLAVGIVIIISVKFSSN